MFVILSPSPGSMTLRPYTRPLSGLSASLVSRSFPCLGPQNPWSHTKLLPGFSDPGPTRSPLSGFMDPLVWFPSLLRAHGPSGLARSPSQIHGPSSPTFSQSLAPGTLGPMLRHSLSLDLLQSHSLLALLCTPGSSDHIPAPLWVLVSWIFWSQPSELMHSLLDPTLSHSWATRTLSKPWACPCRSQVASVV